MTDKEKEGLFEQLFSTKLVDGLRPIAEEKGISVCQLAERILLERVRPTKKTPVTVFEAAYTMRIQNGYEPRHAKQLANMAAKRSI